MNELFIKIDDAKWVQGEKFGYISNAVKSEIDLKIIDKSFKLRKILGSNFYTPCMFASWRQVLVNDLWKTLPLHKCVAAVSSHYNIGGGLNPISTVGKNEIVEEVFEKAIYILNQFGLVLVNSRRLEDLLSNHVQNLAYIPNGVDSSFFTKRKVHSFNKDKIRVGWVGKQKGAKNYELLKEVSALFECQNIELAEVAVKKGQNNIFSKEEMREFYYSLDFYLCTSWHEGTPNPCLEAASCGVPLITTRVGNMPELVKDKENSFFIEPNIESLKTVVEDIKKITTEDYLLMSNNLCDSILKDWQWADRAQDYATVLKKFVRGLNE